MRAFALAGQAGSCHRQSQRLRFGQAFAQGGCKHAGAGVSGAGGVDDIEPRQRGLVDWFARTDDAGAFGTLSQQQLAGQRRSQGFSLLQREDEGGAGLDVRELAGWAQALEQAAGNITAAIEQTLTAYAHQLSQAVQLAG